MVDLNSNRSNRLSVCKLVDEFTCKFCNYMSNFHSWPNLSSREMVCYGNTSSEWEPRRKANTRITRYFETLVTLRVHMKISDTSRTQVFWVIECNALVAIEITQMKTLYVQSFFICNLRQWRETASPLYFETKRNILYLFSMAVELSSSYKVVKFISKLSCSPAVGFVLITASNKFTASFCFPQCNRQTAILFLTYKKMSCVFDY